MELTISERFPAVSPFQIRREKAGEVFLLIRRINNYNEKNNNTSKPRKIRRQAGDNWF